MSTFGPAYDVNKDGRRIQKQHEVIRSLMMDKRWRTLQEICDATGEPHSSVSAQLRHLRKPAFGAYTLNRRRRNENGGTHEYQVLPSTGETKPKRVTPLALLREVQDIVNDRGSGGYLPDPRISRIKVLLDTHNMKR